VWSLRVCADVMGNFHASAFAGVFADLDDSTSRRGFLLHGCLLVNERGSAVSSFSCCWVADEFVSVMLEFRSISLHYLPYFFHQRRWMMSRSTLTTIATLTCRLALPTKSFHA
jgi:hypothetical protein